MPIRVTRPEFNLRAKINQLDGMIPYEKMPQGSTIQIRHHEIADQFRGTATGAGGYADRNEGVLFTTISGFCPRLKDSLVLIQSTNISVNEYSNSDDQFFMGAYVVNDKGSIFNAYVQGNAGYESFNNALNAQFLAFNNIIHASTWRGKPCDIQIRIGPLSISGTHNGFNINRDPYAASIANATNKITFTLTEFKQ